MVSTSSAIRLAAIAVQHEGMISVHSGRNLIIVLANADIAGARLIFQRAAEAGDAAAAFALAETYDPLVLRKLGTKGGITSNIALAQSWYEKARDLGSTIAPERLVRLTQLPE